VIGLLVVGAAAVALAAAVRAGLVPVLGQPALARTNVRGRPVPTAGGVVIPLALLPLWAVASIDLVLDREPWSPQLTDGLLATVSVVLAFGLLGLVDDLLGGGDARGFAGHLAALRSGRLTTGGIKLLGGGAAAVIAVAPLRAAGGATSSAWTLLLDAVLVALAANLANLLDRAPGRVTKVSILALVALVVAGSVGGLDAGGEVGRLAGTVAVVGAAVGLLGAELRERLMLGDAGANVLGAALGVGVVLVAPTGARIAVAGVLLALNLASERVSFSTVVERTPPLRWLDRLGRLPE